MLDTGRQTEGRLLCSLQRDALRSWPACFSRLRSMQMRSSMKLKEEQGLGLRAEEEEAYRVQQGGAGYSGRRLL